MLNEKEMKFLKRMNSSKKYFISAIIALIILSFISVAISYNGAKNIESIWNGTIQDAKNLQTNTENEIFIKERLIASLIITRDQTVKAIWIKLWGVCSIFFISSSFIIGLMMLNKKYLTIMSKSD